ncbi:hypothetical protein [Thalassotalea sp. PS06]|uniref:hypothetical protein n=1 Tax=Thalassotalea sp. PS06 TaxID=2594005 RepID=UPI001C8F2D11|nr:hypothetical protein [Thalassotalea sp. PS06]
MKDTELSKPGIGILALVILLIFIPFWESWYGTSLWGLNLYSPAHMDAISDQLRVFKIVLVCAGVFLLLRKSNAIKTVIKSSAARNLVLACC